MRFKIIVLVLFIFTFFTFSTNVANAGCSVANTSPASGPVGTFFKISVQNCTADIDLSKYEARVYDSTGQNLLGTYSLVADGFGGAQADINNLTTAGTYRTTLRKTVAPNDYISTGGFTITALQGENTTKFECQAVNGGNYCFKCTYNGANKINCMSPSNVDLGSCPASCRQAVPGSATDKFTQAQITGNCADQAASIDTAIGCIPFGNISLLSGFFFKWGMGAAGGVALLVLIYASFQLMTSQGDPKRLQTGRELLTSAVAGIILLAFSVLVIRIIGVDILGIF